MLRLLALVLLVAAAPPSARLSASPPATPGEAWRSAIVVRGASPASLRVAAARGSERRTTTARRVRGRYPLRLVFPSAGTWTLTTSLAGRRVRLGTVSVRAPEHHLLAPATLLLAGDTLYVAEGRRGQVTAVDLPTGRIRVAARGFANPYGLAALPSGDVLVTSRNTVAAFTPSTGAVRTIATGDPAVEFGPVAVRDVHAYVGSSDNRLRRVDLRTGALEVVAGTGVAGGSGDGGAALDAQITAVHGLAFDVDGTLLLGDTGNDRIRRLDLTRGTIAAAFGDVPGAGAIAVAPDGAVHVAEMNAARFTRIDRSGARTSVGGFGIPGGIALVPDGTRYVLDARREGLYRIGVDGRVVQLRLSR